MRRIWYIGWNIGVYWEAEGEEAARVRLKIVIVEEIVATEIDP